MLQNCLDHGEHTKLFCTVRILMHKIRMPEGTVEKDDLTHISTRAIPLQTHTDIDDFIENVKERLEAHIDKYTSKGSNWVVPVSNTLLYVLLDTDCYVEAHHPLRYRKS